jgi:hypothetical protein
MRAAQEASNNNMARYNTLHDVLTFSNSLSNMKFRPLDSKQAAVAKKKVEETLKAMRAEHNPRVKALLQIKADYFCWIYNSRKEPVYSVHRRYGGNDYLMLPLRKINLLISDTRYGYSVRNRTPLMNKEIAKAQRATHRATKMKKKFHNISRARKMTGSI